METVPSISQDCDNFKSYHIFKKPGRKKKIMRKLGCLHEQAESFYVEVSLKQLNRAQTSLFL